MNKLIEFPKSFLLHIVCLGVFVSALVISAYFMNGMLDVLKQTTLRCEVRNQPTNEVCRSGMTIDISGCGNTVESSDGNAIMTAYDSLSNELSTWMAIMGICQVLT